MTATIKKVLSFFVLIIMVFSLFAGCKGGKGTVFESDGFQYKVFSDHTELMAYIGSASVVTVPDSLKGKKYYMRVRAYYHETEYVYGSWSKYKAITCK